MTELAAAFNPFEPGYFDDPYAQFGRIRATNPVHHSMLGPWILFAYADVVKLLRDPTASVEPDKAAPIDGPFAQRGRDEVGPGANGNHNMLSLDAPDHTRLRRLVSKAFTPRVIEGLRPRVQALVDAALDDAVARTEGAGRGLVDLVPDLAFPLPFAVISEMLGLPEDRRNEVRGWSHAMVKTLDPILNDDEIAAAQAGAEAMSAYVDEMVAWKRGTPGDDLLSALIAVEDAGEKLSTDELHAQVTLLYIAGHETTVNLIGNGLLALLRNRDQLELLAADASLLPNAVDELLRYDSPVQFSRRIVLRDLEIGDTTITEGSLVLTGLAAANRDPAQWGDDADRLDVRREGLSHHVAFGGGSHYCLGAALAKLEAQIAIGTVLQRFPDLELDADGLVRNGRINLRGLERLPVRL